MPHRLLRLRPARRPLLAGVLAALALALAPPASTHVPRVRWQEATSVRYPLGDVEEVQGGAAAGRLFLFGGYNTTGARTGLYAGPLDPLPYAFALDPATGGWRRLPPLDTAPIVQPFTHAGTTTDGASFWFVGGEILRDPARPRAGVVSGSRYVYRYDIAAQRYVRLPNLPAPRAAGAAVVLPDRHELHFFGGTDPSSLHTGVDHRDHWVLNLDGGGSWTPAPPIPDDPAHRGWGVNHLGAAELGGRIYLVGGQHLLTAHLRTTQRAWRYDPATMDWKALADLPQPRSHVASSTFAVGGDVVVIGGEIHHDRSDALNSTTVYSPAQDRWEENTPLPRPNLVSGVAGLVDGDLWTATGSYSDAVYQGQLAR